MDLQQILTIADELVFAKTGRHLRDLEEVILQGTLQNKTYSDMAEEYHCSEGHLRGVAAELWQIISEKLGENIKKSNLTATLKRLNLSVKSSTFFKDILPIHNINYCINNHQDLSQNSDEISNQFQHNLENNVLTDIPLLGNFYGRESELTQLENSIIKEKNKLITVVGMSGIGKTSLIIKLVDLIQDSFDYIIWYDLQYFSDFDTLMADLLELLSEQEIRKNNPQDYITINTHNHWQKQIIQYFKRYHCLLVIDNLQLAFKKAELFGLYQETYQNFSTFFKLITELAHQSCIIVNSWEKLREIDQLENNKKPCKLLKLEGSEEVAYKILKNQSISLEHLSEAKELINLYAGNPLWLNIIATTIKDLFDGQLSQLWQYQKFYLDRELKLILDQQLAFLSDHEKQVIWELAKQPQAMSLTNLFEMDGLSQEKIIEIIQSLKSRCLVKQEKQNNQVILIIEPMIRQYFKQLKSL
jgi:GTP-binding protein EngB required for normal cell division